MTWFSEAWACRDAESKLKNDRFFFEALKSSKIAYFKRYLIVL